MKSKYWAMPGALMLCILSARHLETKNSRSFELTYSAAHTPYVTTSFNFFRAPFLIDTGFGGCISLPKEVLELERLKIHLGKSRYLGYQGALIEAPHYLFHTSSFLDLKCKNLTIDEYQVEFHQISKAKTVGEWATQHEPLPAVSDEKDLNQDIGMDFLSNFNFMLDFKNHFFKIYNLGYTPLFSFPYGLFFYKASLPFEFIPGLGLIFKFDVGGRACHFLLDTGATFSYIRAELEQKAPLILKLNFFSPLNLLPLESLNHPKIDGILGMDFLQGKVLFFDMEKGSCLIK